MRPPKVLLKGLASQLGHPRGRVGHLIARMLPLDDGSVHALITVNTIYFVDDLRQAFAELARVLARDGRAVIGLGDPDAMARMPFTEHGFRLRPVPDVIDLITDTGLGLGDHRGVGASDRAFHLLVARRAG